MKRNGQYVLIKFLFLMKEKLLSFIDTGKKRSYFLANLIYI